MLKESALFWVFLYSVETWACFVNAFNVAVSENRELTVAGADCTNESEDRASLLWSAGIFWEPATVEATDVADRYRLSVHTLLRAVGAMFVVEPSALIRAVEPNHEVVSDFVESALTMPSVDVIGGEVSAFFSG